MTFRRYFTVEEKREVTNQDLDEALFVFLNPNYDSKWTDMYVDEMKVLVREAYAHGYRLRLEGENND